MSAAARPATAARRPAAAVARRERRKSRSSADRSTLPLSTPWVAPSGPPRPYPRAAAPAGLEGMPMPANPPQNPDSPFASFAGHHVGVCVPDYDAALAWYTEKLHCRVLQEWPYGDLRLAYLSPAADDDFHLELLAGPVEHPQPVLDV